MGAREETQVTTGHKGQKVDPAVQGELEAENKRRLDSARAAQLIAANQAEPGEIPPTVFQSKYKNFRIQIKPGRVMVASDGEKVIIPPVVACFSNGVYATNDKETIEIMKFGRVNSAGQRMKKARRNFGLGLDYWLASEIQEEAKKREMDQVTTMLANNPELARSVRDLLKADSFPMPGSKSAGPSEEGSPTP